MQPEDLTPADRELAQEALLKIWLGRKKRERWLLTQGAHPAVKRYDVNGRQIVRPKH